MNYGNENFEEKKVQKVKGSYYMYLPKEWCDKYDIEQKKRVLLKRLEDDSLLLRANSDSFLNSSFEINLDLDKKPQIKPEISDEIYQDYLYNQYLTAYIIGFKTIIIKKRTAIPIKQRTRILNLTRSFNGMMIISESENSIVIEDTTAAVDLRMMMRQIISQVEISFSTFIEIVEAERFSEFNDLIQQDDHIDGYRYTIERQVHRILRYPMLGLEANVNATECLHHSELAKLIERYGDYILGLAKIMQLEKLTDKSAFLDVVKRAYQIYSEIQDNFERNESLIFFNLIEKVQKEAEECTTIINSSNPDKNFYNPVRRLFNICADIAEIRINDILTRKMNNHY